MYYVYFLKSLRNDKVYIGHTNKKPKDRLIEHNAGSNKWTSQNKPFVLLYYESYFCEQDAIHREKFYKTGFGRKIKNIIIESVSAIGGSASG